MVENDLFICFYDGLFVTTWMVVGMSAKLVSTCIYSHNPPCFDGFSLTHFDLMSFFFFALIEFEYDFACFSISKIRVRMDNIDKSIHPKLVLNVKNY